MPTTDFIPPEQLEKARTLIALTWYLSKKPQGNLTIRNFDVLAEHIEAGIECTIVGKSIMNFAKSLENGSLRGFKRNTTKETLAGYVLVKAGIIAEVEVVRMKGSGILVQHPKHIYYVMYEEHYEELKLLLPPDVLPLPPKIKPLPQDEENNFLRPISSYFTETAWYMYCRTRTGGGIYRHILVIKAEKSGCLNNVYMRNGSSQIEDFVGTIGADAGQGYLIFNLVTQESKQKHLHLKVKVSRGTFPQLAIGQLNFISSFRDQIMTDAVVLVRAPNDLDIETAAKCLLLGTPEYLELPLCIRRYFSIKGKCRQEAPKTDIINLHQFSEWLDAQRAQKDPSKYDPLLAQYCDEYAVFYQTADRRIKERCVRIGFNRDIEEICAAAAPDYRGKFREADVFRCGNTVTLFQTEITGCETHTCFLSFHIHLEGCFDPPRYEGTVNGCWQGLNGGCSPALVVSKSAPEYSAKAGQWAREYFGKKRKRFSSKNAQKTTFNFVFRRLGLAFAAWLERRLAKPQQLGCQHNFGIAF